MIIPTAWNDWERPDICKEIYLHIKLLEPLCRECQAYWDEWTSAQQHTAVKAGRYEYSRYVMEEAGRDAIVDGYLSKSR